ncbi:zinc-ribbon domain-containing protein [Candidatus Pacearchaeota archaeon]|nr:zinc-ribbon domain-containing protein [Candidatus Pacearchaeota archaeon]
MIITCGKCRTKYRIDDNVVQREEFKVRCAKCNNSFLVKKPSSDSEVPPHVIKKGAASPAKKHYPDNPDCKVITICNQKGGVAKTTTCLNLAASLVLMKKRVLVVDFDIQSNLTLLLGHKDARSFFDVVHAENDSLSSYLVKTKHGFSLLPSNSKMALLSKKHLPRENFEYMLRDKLLEVKSDFDYILIDTPPSGDFYTLNALLASNTAVTPVPCDYLSLNGVSHIAGMINVINEKINHKINMKVLVTLFEPGNTVGNVVLEQIKSKYQDKVLNVMIEKDQKVQESQIVHTPTIFYSQDSVAAKQYQQLANELDASLTSFQDQPMLNSNM